MKGRATTLGLLSNDESLKQVAWLSLAVKPLLSKRQIEAQLLSNGTVSLPGHTDDMIHEGLQMPHWPDAFKTPTGRLSADPKPAVLTSVKCQPTAAISRQSPPNIPKDPAFSASNRGLDFYSSTTHCTQRLFIPSTIPDQAFDIRACFHWRQTSMRIDDLCDPHTMSGAPPSSARAARDLFLCRQGVLDL